MAKLSRRAGLAAAILPAFGQPTVGRSHFDALLLQMVGQLAAHAIEEERLVRPYYRLVLFEYPSELEARLDQLAERQEALRRQMSDVAAVSLSGLRAKAQAVMLRLIAEAGEDEHVDDVDQALVWSLCRDLL